MWRRNRPKAMKLDGLKVALKGEIGATEAIAFATAASVAMATAFNLGYFQRTHWGYVSLLSAQDILLGVAVAVPLVVFVWPLLLMLVDDTTASDEKVRRGTSFAAFIGLAASGVVIYFIDKTPFGEIHAKSAAIISIFPLIVFFGTLEATKIRARQFLFALPFAIPFFLGTVAFEYQTADFENSSKSSILYNDGTRIEERIVRITSSYIFHFNGSDLTLSKLADIRRIVENLGKANG